MKTITLLLGACTLVALPMGTAGAGPCTTEIENMTKLLASRDAGAGPTAGAASPPQVSILRAPPWARRTQARQHRLRRRSRDDRSIRPRRQ